MNRARLGALGIAALLAPTLLLATGCGVFDSVKEEVDKATNSVEVCKAAIDLYNKQDLKFRKAITDVSTAQPGDAKAIEAYTTTMKTELTTLHEGLKAQADNAKDTNVKKGIADLDTEIAALAADPKKLVEDQKAGEKVDTAIKAMNKACNATTPSENPQK